MKKFFSLLIIALFALNAAAWDAKGHRIVTTIAYQNLTKKARKQVDKVLGVKGIIYYASWADEIKSDTIYPQSHGWHFQNLNPGMSDAALDSLFFDKTKEGQHLFYAKDSLTRVLMEHPDDVDALKFIVHLAGDEFQPMHMGHSEDLGGNRVRLTWFGQKTNMHSLWDRWLLDYTQWSCSEYVTLLTDKYSSEKKSISNLSELECLHMTYAFCNRLYAYRASLGEELPRSYEYKYYYTCHDILEYQLYAAGIQLAKLLNEIYK